PNIRNFLCTTFELRSNNVEKSWSYLEIRIKQENNLENSNRVTFILITHERGELPFSAYDRHIHTNLPPDTSVSLYFSKSVTTRLNTGRNPCHVGADAKFIASQLTMDINEEYNNKEQHSLTGITLHNSTILNEMNDYDLNTIPNARNNNHENDPDPDPDPDHDPDPDPDHHHHHQWYLDYLDTIRMKNKQQTFASETTNYLQYAKIKLKQKINEQRLNKLNTVSLFGTEFLYSREACGWIECCTKVAYNCNCTCTLDLLSINRTSTQTNFLCERTQCQDEQIPYETCPLPCIQTKFIKHSEVRLPGFEDGLPILTSRLKLVRSESVQVAMEEEIFSLAKLFSEVGGLCSLFIGFSCIFLFELLEALIVMYYPRKKFKQSIPLNNNNNNSTQSDIQKINNQKSITTPFIQAINIQQNHTKYEYGYENNSNHNHNKTNKFGYIENTMKPNVSTVNNNSIEEYLDKDVQFIEENLHFIDNHIDTNHNNDNHELQTTDQSINDPLYHPIKIIILLNNDNNNNNDSNTQEHTLSLSNQYEHNLDEISESNHVYILPIWLSTNIPLHIIKDRQNDKRIKSFQISSNHSKRLTNSLDNNNNEDEKEEECIYSETTT
ncbi:uncharacterized protein DC041_0002192, partial [Schistosoma bovis]